MGEERERGTDTETAAKGEMPARPSGQAAEPLPSDPPTLNAILTAERFARLFPRVPMESQERYRAAVVAACERFGINTPERIAAFLAQVSHESGGLLFLQEIWGPSPAQERYETRSDLGNVLSGDGYRFRGRGPLQITGRYNYARAGAALGLPLESEPELLAEIENGMAAAAWFWSRSNLNELADQAAFDRITRTINGGLNGLPDRIRRWNKARVILGLL